MAALASGCGNIESGGSSADGAPGVPDAAGDAGQADAPVAPERGAFAWQQHLFTSFPQALVDRSGGASVAASFSGPIDLGGGEVSAGAASNLLLARFDGEGGHRTSVGYGADGEEFVIQHALDLEDNGTVAGLFRGDASVGGDPLGPSTGFNSYVARYTPVGKHVWSVQIASPGTAFVRGASINGSGQTASAGNFDPSVAVLGQELTSAGANDIFYLRLDQSGGIATFARFGGAGNDLGMAALFDGLGRVYLVGVTDGAIDFGGGAAVETGGGRDLFIMHEVRWARRFGGPGDDSPRGIAVGAGGEIALTGEFAGTASFGGDDHDSRGFLDCFAASYDPAGELVWSRAVGGGGDDRGLAVAVNPAGGLLVSLAFHDRIELGGEPLEAVGEDFNGAVVKYGP